MREIERYEIPGERGREPRERVAGKRGSDGSVRCDP
jgi:hypothetical protein